MLAHNGQIIVGGMYIDFNGVLDRNLQGWDGVNHYLIGDAFDQSTERAYALASLNGDLIAAGKEDVLGNIARWDGSQWLSMNGGMNDLVHCLTLHNGELYAGGSFTLAGGSAANRVARWTGSTWEPLGTGLNATVRTLTSYGGELIAGGDFLADNGGAALNRIARWDGTAWLPIANGLNNRVNTLLEYGGTLWIGGEFSFDMDSLVNSVGLMTYSNGILQTAPVQTIATVGLLKDPSFGLCVGHASGSTFLNDGMVHTIAFGQAMAFAELNGSGYLGGRGTQGSYSEVTRIGRLLQGVDHSSLDAGNIDMSRTPWGHSFVPPVMFGPGFEVPKGSGNSTIDSFAPWIVGRSNGVLMGSLAQFGLIEGPGEGPVADTRDTVFHNRYYQVWQLTQADIDHHIAHWQDPGYEVPYMVASWPGNGNVNNGEAALLGPFTDLDSDGLYEPTLGESPLIRGDMAVYTINHGLDTSVITIAPIGSEVHTLFYAFNNSWDPYLHNTVFCNQKIINRSSLVLDSTWVGSWTDIEIGAGFDDFVGCDTTLNAFFGYNADASDVSGYADRPPAQALVYLNHHMSAHAAYSQGIDPWSADEVYALLRGQNQDGTPVVTPGGDTTTFLYSGDPNDPLQWHEASVGNAPGDRRAIGSIGPFTFAPGDTICVDLAFVFAQDTLGDNLTSVTLLKQRVAQVRDWYAQQDINCTGSYGIVTGLSNQLTSVDGFELFPNPTTGVLSLSRTSGKSASVQVFSTTGSLLALAGWTAGSNSLILDVSALPAGVYVIVVQDKWNRTIKRFVKADG